MGMVGLSIRHLRIELGMTLEAFAAATGVSGRGQMSDIERGREGCAPAVALAIEALSGGRINAAELNSVVALARGADATKADETPGRLVVSPRAKAGKGGCAQLSALPGGGQ